MCMLYVCVFVSVCKSTNRVNKVTNLGKRVYRCMVAKNGRDPVTVFSVNVIVRLQKHIPGNRL